MTRINPYLAVAVVLTAAAWAASAVVYPRLPATVPTHWNIHGRVDGHGPRALALVPVPVVMVGMIGFFLVLPSIAPRESTGADSLRPACMVAMAVVVGVFAYLHAIILLATWQHVTKAPHPVDIGRSMFAALFLAVAAVGGVLGKVRRNPYVGVRVPWTLASDRVWDDTHRLAARCFVAGGLLAFFNAAAGFPVAVSFAVMVVAVVSPVVYSFVLYKRLERTGGL